MKTAFPPRALALLLLTAFITGCASSKCWRKDNSLAHAWQIIAGKKFVDLTHSFGTNTPVWPGFGPAKIVPAADPKTGTPYTIAKDGFRAWQYTMVGEYGTHIDAPAHFDANGRSLDELPVQQMILPLVVFDITPKLRDEPNHAWTVADILEWEKLHGRVPPGAFAALRTDMHKDWEANPERFKREPFPAWTFEAIQFLYEQRHVTATGHEAMDTDTTSEMKSETWLLRHGHWQIEMLANLDQVPPTGALLVVAWPKPKGAVGFPVRAFAILP